jgi:putative colanic acid biosynthesis acetyltransferase WcaF
MTTAAQHESAAWVDLGSFSNPEYDPGGGRLGRMLWYFVSLLAFESGWFPFIRLKPPLLRLFGARIGTQVVIKPYVRIKYPWRLKIGNNCWIGQDVWIDNLADVAIGANVCISQGTFFCTGDHAYQRTTFDLITRKVTVGEGAWVAARSLVLGGVEVGANSLVAAGSVVTKNVAPGAIVAGNPARFVKQRERPA